MSEERIRISQSLLKRLRPDELDEPQVCPKLIKLEFIDGVRPGISTAMQQGNYFETLILGANRDGEKTVDLPRLKNDQKNATHVRIDDMAERFMTDIRHQYCLDLSACHQEIIFEVPGLEHELIMHLDLVSPILDPTIDPTNALPAAIIDIKLTESLATTFPPFCWGRPQLMDHVQADFYYEGWRISQGEAIPFYYAVFEHGTTRNFKFFRKEVSALNRAELAERIRKADATLTEWEEEDFPIKPNAEDCQRCPLKNSCPGYTIGTSVEVIRI